MVSAMVECSQIDFELGLQDEEDRDSVALWGSDNKKHNSNTTTMAPSGQGSIMG